MSSTLNDLDSFLKRIEPGIEAITGEEQDIASFMRLMRVFNEVVYSYLPLFMIVCSGTQTQDTQNLYYSAVRHSIAT